MLLQTYRERSAVIQAKYIAYKMGPSGFEPESDGPQPSSIDQANPRALIYTCLQTWCGVVPFGRCNSVITGHAERRNLINQLNVRNKHSPAAISLQADFV